MRAPAARSIALAAPIPPSTSSLSTELPDASYYERDLPASGILVWRIDESNRATVNNDEANKLVDLVCADGLFGDAGFPSGNRPLAAGGDNLDFWAHDEEYVRNHEGNLGDGTDLFSINSDGYSIISNPASPQGTSLSDIRSRGAGVVARINLRDDRWAGDIEGTAIWADTINIVGDVTVQPGADLMIRAGTVVLVGPDGLNSGLDRSALGARGSRLASQHRWRGGSVYLRCSRSRTG